MDGYGTAGQGGRPSRPLPRSTTLSKLSSARRSQILNMTVPLHRSVVALDLASGVASAAAHGVGVTHVSRVAGLRSQSWLHCRRLFESRPSSPSAARSTAMSCPGTAKSSGSVMQPSGRLEKPRRVEG